LSHWEKGFTNPFVTYLPARPPTHHVVALRFRHEMEHPALPHTSRLQGHDHAGLRQGDDILAQRPDGIFLSNGPGDPAPLSYAIDTIRQPRWEKNRSSHLPGASAARSGSRRRDVQVEVRAPRRQPAGAEPTHQRVEITRRTTVSQCASTNLPRDLEPTHINLNDSTLEGMRHRRWPIISVQYHPEASAGPHDSGYFV